MKNQNHPGYIGRLQRWLVTDSLEWAVTSSALMTTRAAIQRYLESGEVSCLHRILHLEPTNREALRALAELYEKRGDGERLGRFYGELAQRRW